MKTTITALIATGVLSACTYIPTNGNDTSFTREGTLDCPPGLQIDDSLLQGSEQAPLRCGPQAQALNQ